MCQERLQQNNPNFKLRAGDRWFESNHQDDEIALLSEPKPPPKGGQSEIIIMGVAQRSEKPMEGNIRVGSECLRQACQK